MRVTPEQITQAVLDDEVTFSDVLRALVQAAEEEAATNGEGSFQGKKTQFEVGCI